MIDDTQTKKLCIESSGINGHIVSGVIFLYDAVSIRTGFLTPMESAIQIFGAKILENSVIVFNRNDKIDNEQFRAETISWCIDKTSPLYDKFNINPNIISDHIVFIDTKGDFAHYSQKLYNKISTIFSNNNGGINIFEQNAKLEQEINVQYQLELQDQNNYESVTVYHKHCVKTCDWNIGIARGGCDYECDSIPSVQRVLKYNESELRQIAGKKIANKIKNKVYESSRHKYQKKKHSYQNYHSKNEL